MSEKITKFLTPIVVLFFAAALGVTAATTIGTDITTEGDITVDGTTTAAVLQAGGGEGLWLGFSEETGDPTLDIYDPNEEGYDLKINNSVGGSTIVENSSGGNIQINASGGGDVELISSGGKVETETITYTPTSSPIDCDETTQGTLGWANGDSQLCVCNGTSYVHVASTTELCTFNAL